MVDGPAAALVDEQGLVEVGALSEAALHLLFFAWLVRARISCRVSKHRTKSQRSDIMEQVQNLKVLLGSHALLVHVYWNLFEREMPRLHPISLNHSIVKWVKSFKV